MFLNVLKNSSYINLETLTELSNFLTILKTFFSISRNFAFVVNDVVTLNLNTSPIFWIEPRVSNWLFQLLELIFNWLFQLFEVLISTFSNFGNFLTNNYVVLSVINSPTLLRLHK